MSLIHSQEPTPKNSRNLIRLWCQVALLMWLPFGVAMTGCCSTPVCPEPDPEVVVVGESEIIENPDGTYTVTPGWMLERLEFEQGLRAALERCEQSQE